MARAGGALADAGAIQSTSAPDAAAGVRVGHRFPIASIQPVAPPGTPVRGAEPRATNTGEVLSSRAFRRASVPAILVHADAAALGSNLRGNSRAPGLFGPASSCAPSTISSLWTKENLRLVENRAAVRPLPSAASQGSSRRQRVLSAGRRALVSPFDCEARANADVSRPRTRP